MRSLRLTPLAALALLWVALQRAPAADATGAASAVPGTPASNHLIISANGSTLTGASGGGGGALDWLHAFTGGTLELGGEYQTLANAHWAFGSLSGSVSTGSASDKWTLSAQAHLGNGDIGAFHTLRRFKYRVEGAGITGTFARRLTVELEARHFEVDTAHGTLPKVALGLLLSSHLEMTAAYLRSVTGNLGTELETVRINVYGRSVNWLLGGATGHVAPPIVNFYSGLAGAAPQLREGYIGVTRAFSHNDWSILADYLNVAGERRITLTVVWTLGVGGSAT